MFRRSCWRLLLLGLALFASTLAAQTLPLPADLQASATVINGERDGHWEKLLVVRFPTARRMLSTADGLIDARLAFNHAAHPILWEKLGQTFAGRDGRGGKAYAAHVRQTLAEREGLHPSAMAGMSTAADLAHRALVTREHGPLKVTVIATAGARTNAQRTGVDAGFYIEGEEPAGTINLLVMTNIRLTDAALARALITITEGKTAALQDLGVESSYTPGARATGTGTDSIVVVAGLAEPTATYTGGHSRIGELIGKATHAAVIEALGKQNGFYLPGTQRLARRSEAPAKEAGHLRLALLHLDPRPGDIAGNRARIEAGIADAVAQGADWVVTPELAETGYNFAERVGVDWVAPFPDAWMGKLAAIARDNDIALFVGFAERDGRTRQLFNSVAVIDRDGKVLGTYRKQRVHGGPESWATPGSGRAPFRLDGVAAGVLICADTYHPALADAYRQQGAGILLAPANWPPVDGMGPGNTWEKRSQETGIPLVVTNRTGVEPELAFTAGESVIAVAGRRVLSRQSATPTLLLVDWDRAAGFRAVTPVPSGN